jgi:hypothetical protein
VGRSRPHEGLAITQENLTNQQGVVKSEVRVNVLNQPYGGFPWLDMPQYANTNWYNAHNFYGDLKDLDAATLEDVQSFFKTFYAPNNAVLAVVGDFKPDQGRAFVQQYFAAIPASDLPPQPDIAEPRQTQKSGPSRRIRWPTSRPWRLPTTCPTATRPNTTRWACSTRSCCKATTAASTSRWCKRRATPVRSPAASMRTWATCSTTKAPCCGSAT